MCSSHVAVIVVHGVGDPGANTSVDNVASILLAQRDNQQHTQYEPFTCEGIQIGVRPAPVPGHTNASLVAPPPRAPRGWLDERAPGIIAKQDHLANQGTSMAFAPTGPALPEDVAYTRDQLSDYRVNPDRNEATYATTRLTGVRRGIDGDAEKTVHLYELYWADLVSLRKGLRLLEDVYQLFLHLAHIGLLVVNAAMAEKPYADSGCWKSFAWCHRWAVRSLTLPIPILNLMAIPVLAFALSSLVPGAFMKLSALLLIALILLVGSGVIRFTFRRRGWLQKRIDDAIAGLSIGTVLVAIACACSTGVSEFVVGMLVFAAGMAAVMSLLAGYEKIRPGAYRIAIVMGAVVLADLLFECARAANEPGRHHNLAIALRVGGVLLVLLGVCWCFLFVCSLLAMLIAMCALRETSKDEKPTAYGFVGTALLSLGVPTVAFFLLTTFIATGVSHAVLAEVGDRPYHAGGLVISLMEAGTEQPTPPASVPSTQPRRTIRMQVAAYWSAIAGFPLMPIVVLLGIGLILAAWVAAPSVMSELTVPEDQKEPAREAYGKWLDRSLPLLWLAGFAAYLAGLVITPAAVLGFILINPEYSQHEFAFVQPLLNRLFVSLGALIAGVGAIWLLPQRLGKWFDGFTVPIRAALDVDAYLRLFPLDGNPRARIFARYSSLLRYIASWTSPTDANVRYESIVIVSHSQGTVIGADLFRYLKISGARDESLQRLFLPDDHRDKLKVRMLTMGCPLRQLYGSRFPHTYRWAAEIERVCNGVQEHVGVDQWINAYRSGDYVGRYLWNANDYWKTTYAKGINEFCVGPGAHVHYWDGTAPVVAQAIDDLITA